jgi:hypothetical protein
MDDIIEKTKNIIEMMDRGDYMTAISYFEAEFRQQISENTDDTEFWNLWRAQMQDIDDENWMGAIQRTESMRQCIESM